MTNEERRIAREKLKELNNKIQALGEKSEQIDNEMLFLLKEFQETSSILLGDLHINQELK